MLKKLRIKFIAITMGYVTIMLIVILGLVVHFTKYNLEMQNRQMIQKILNDPFPMSGPKDRDIKVPCILIQINQQGEIIRTAGKYMDDYDEIPIVELTMYAISSNAQSGEIKEYDLRFYKSKGPILHTIVFVDITGERSTIQDLIHSCIAIGILSFLIFFASSIGLANWAVKPVETAWLQQKQFVADASHELKTPLTVIMTNAELLQSDVDCKEKQLSFTNNILTMSHQMRSLVERLLELARMDNGASNMHMEIFNFSQLVSECLLPFEPMFFEANLVLTSYIEENLWLKGSGSHLRQVIDIFLDNALKYSDKSGTVHLVLKRQGSHCILSVSSSGKMITQEDLKNIFKRFYRIDKARTRDGSCGLGLSIAQNIIEEHNGKIWAESKQGTNTFFIQLNLCSNIRYS